MSKTMAVTEQGYHRDVKSWAAWTEGHPKRRFESERLFISKGIFLSDTWKKTVGGGFVNYQYVYSSLATFGQL